MIIRLLTVGKPRDEACARLHDEYAGRLAPLGIRYRHDWVPDIKAGGAGGAAHSRRREAEALLQRLAPEESVVALDVRGVALTSPALAEALDRGAARPRVLIIGGPSGLDDRIRERADACWSLSPMTLPHELVRVLIAEQIYRAGTILKRLPYHK